MKLKEIEQIFEETARDLGFDSFFSFAKIKMIQTLQEKLAVSISEIDKYEKKYSMKLEEFQSKFHEIKNFSIIEKEDDEMEWEWQEEPKNWYPEVVPPSRKEYMETLMSNFEISEDEEEEEYGEEEEEEGI